MSTPKVRKRTRRPALTAYLSSNDFQINNFILDMRKSDKIKSCDLFTLLNNLFLRKS